MSVQRGICHISAKDKNRSGSGVRDLKGPAMLRGEPKGPWDSGTGALPDRHTPRWCSRKILGPGDRATAGQRRPSAAGRAGTAIEGKAATRPDQGQMDSSSQASPPAGAEMAARQAQQGQKGSSQGRQAATQANVGRQDCEGSKGQVSPGLLLAPRSQGPVRMESTHREPRPRWRLENSRTGRCMAERTLHEVSGGI